MNPDCPEGTKPQLDFPTSLLVIAVNGSLQAWQSARLDVPPYVLGFDVEVCQA